MTADSGYTEISAGIEWRNAILGSVVVHLLLVLGMLVAAWDWPSDRRPNRTGLNIEARVVDSAAFRQQANEISQQRQQAERAEQQRLERERLRAERDAALQQQREREEQARLQREQQQQAEVAEQQRLEQERLQRERQQALDAQAERERQAELQREREAERRRQELEQRRQAEAQRQRDEEAQRQRELEEIRQQREQAERRRQQEQERLQQLEDQRQRELEQQRRDELIAQEQAEQQAAANAGRLGTLKEQYVATIQAAIRAAWIRPPSAIDEIVCEVRVVQIPGGEVVDAVITRPCNADSATQRSIIAAVKRDDLPYRGFEEVFEREISFTFRAGQDS